MELKDFVVTPIVIFGVYTLAYFIRPKVTDFNTRKFFFPALTVKIIGAIAVGFVYQFYYGGGDTFTYHTHGSRIIWEAFMDSPITGIKLFFNAPITDGVYSYAHRIWFYNEPHSFFVIQIATILDFFTFSTYSSTAVLFAGLSFSGIWAFYLCFYNKYKDMYFGLSIAILFVPTVFFWGSGILKDTVTLGALGWLTYTFDKTFIQGRLKLFNILILVISSWIIYNIKVYIILAFIPALIVWLYFSRMNRIKSLVVKVLVAPILFSLTIGLGYLTVLKIGQDNPRYEINKIPETARITAYDIGFYTGANAGSGYSLGELDGTFASMIRLLPEAINVSLFRPYIWEVKNPLMLLSSLESLVVLVLTIYVIFNTSIFKLYSRITNSEVAFSLVFSLLFAFAVGVSTFNFGTLMRYKIPLMPFYLTALMIVWNYSKRDKKLSSLASTE